MNGSYPARRTKMSCVVSPRHARSIELKVRRTRKTRTYPSLRSSCNASLYAETSQRVAGGTTAHARCATKLKSNVVRNGSSSFTRQTTHYI